MRSTRNLFLRMLTAMAAVILLGAGVAAAESLLASDDIDIDCDDPAFAGDDECLLDDEDVATNHGALVSAAARDHSNDERCGNHGAWVSSVARGLDDCVEAEEADEVAEAVDCDDPANVDDEACLDDEANDDEGEGEGPPEGTHGALVSEAAKDRSNDERCGNHGAWVSSVARGLDDCVEADDNDADNDDEAEVSATADVGKGNGRGNNGNGNGRGRP